jgi:hypothetical protein
MHTKQRRCPILVETKGQMIKSDLFASDAEQPADISIKIRDRGWKPFRVRFDDSNSSWVVSTIEYAKRGDQSARTPAPGPRARNKTLSSPST